MSTGRSAPTCRTSSRSATSSAHPCWRTRPGTRRLWGREARQGGPAPPAGALIGEFCRAVERGWERADIGKPTHPHPTLGESIGRAAELFEGVCPALPPKKKK